MALRGCPMRARYLEGHRPLADHAATAPGCGTIHREFALQRASMKRKNRLTQKMAILLLASVSLFVMAGKLQAQEGQKTKKLINVFVTDALIVRGYGSVRVAVYVIDDSSQKQLWFRKPRAKRIKAQPALGFSACAFFSTESPVFGRRVSLKFWPTNSAGCNQMKRSFWTGRRSTNSSKESTRHFEVTVRASICL